VNLERLRWGEWIAGIGALVLLLVTFRSWYKVSGTDLHVSAWDALHSGRYLLLATAVAGIFLFLINASEDATTLPFPLGWLAAAIGFACTVYVGYRLATPPSDALDADTGIYFGLAGAVGVTIGGLLSARDATAGAVAPPGDETGTDAYAGPETVGGLVPDASSPATWSPAAPAPETTGWSPAPPAAAVPPATAAGAAGSERTLSPGDHVALTAGGARFPAGTVAEVVEVFGGGALVEVKAPDGVADRFEVPESAYERVGAGGAPPAPPAGPTAGDWIPGMPAATAGAAAGASEDWGFEEPGAPDEASAEPTQEKKVPWWKREIGGGKKKEAEVAAAGAGAAVAAAAIAAHDGDGETATEEKPGFFKRMFGGGGKTDEASEAETAVAEPEAAEAESAEPEAAEPEPVAAAPEPEPEAAAPEPEPPAPEPEPAAAVPEPEPEPPAPEPEPEPAAAVPEPEPEPPAPEPEPEPAAAAPEPEPPAPEPEPPAPEPAAAAPEPEPEPPAPEPPAEEPKASAADDAAAAAAGAAAGAAAKPKRKRSSGSRKVPKAAVEAAASDEGAPKVGDEVQLKVSGGKFDAGTRGTVVDVFSAGVIVELSDSDGHIERLDLPFEAVGPADA
jgi:hypothetical protein